MEGSSELYREIILDHSKHPRNYNKIFEGVPSCSGSQKNPICGDQYKLDLILKNNIIQNIAFSGEGCAISKASASIMTDLVKGLSIQQALSLKKDLESLLSSETLSNIPELNAFSGLKNYPDRMHCVMLPWQILERLVN